MIRLAVGSDLPAIVAIYNQAVAAQETADTEPVTVEGRRAWFDRHRPDAHPILVAEIDGAVVGWSSFSEHRPGRSAVRRTAEISYYVDEGHRRQGVASALMQRSLELAPSLGFKNLFAILLEDNAASIALLTRFGFARWGHLPNVAEFDGREVGQCYYGRRVE